MKKLICFAYQLKVTNLCSKSWLTLSEYCKDVTEQLQKNTIIEQQKNGKYEMVALHEWNR